VTMTYDAAGQLTQMLDVCGTSAYGYDLAGRRNSFTAPLSGVQLTYSYDPVGNRLGMTEIGSGLAQTAYGYDAVGSPTSITDPYGGVTTQTFDALNRPSQRLGAATTLLTTFGYDPAGRTPVKNLQPNPWVPPSDPPIGSYIAAYDAAGNRTSAVETTRLVTYTYDAANQVASDFLTGTWFFSPTAAIATYSYDPAGNRRATDGFAPGASNVLTTYTSGRGNRLTSYSPSVGAPVTQSFDANGNLLVQQSGSAFTTYTWDGENRLLSIALSPGTTYPHGTIVTNLYDGNGLRQGYQDSTGRTTLTYDGQNVYRRDVQSIGSVQRYTNEPGNYSPLISQADTRGGVTTHIYAVSDLSGNIRNWWSSGTRGNLDPYAYEAYGVEWITPAPEPPLSYNVPFFYEGDVGYYQDPTTGLIYVRARWYDPEAGRFVGKDPIGFDGGDWDLSRDVGNNPVVRIDPTGLDCGAGCSCGCNNPLSYSKIFSLAYTHIAPLVSRGCIVSTDISGLALTNFLSNVFAQLAECESSNDPTCAAPGNSPPDYGLYQLDCGQYARCGGHTGKICDADQNTYVRVQEVFSVCAGSIKADSTMNSALWAEMGSFRTGSKCRSKIKSMYPNFVSWLQGITCKSSCFTSSCY
jgi:RHS repeat-associated protein